MRLNHQTDYALRMLMQLAVNQDQRLTIADVAERYGLPRNHLMKVANALVHAGYVRATRGRAGGLQLARPPQEIRVGEVIRAMEPDFGLVECLRPGDACLVTGPCRLRGVLEQALEAFVDVLERYTLADLVDENATLRSLVRVVDHPD